MQRGAIALALVAALGLGGSGLGGCKDKKPAAAQQPPVAAPAQPPPATPPRAGSPASPGNNIPAATDPDTGYEARRAELMRRGNPAMMQDAPVLDSSAPKIDAAKMIEKIDAHTVKIGEIKLDLTTGRAEMPAKVAVHNSENVPLEYIVVHENGKAYESLLTVKVTAIELRLALSLMGYEGTIPGEGGKMPPATDSDTVVVSAIVRGKERPITQYMIDRKSHRPPPERTWQVVGFKPDSRDQALLTKDYLTLVPRDFLAPLQFTFYAGNPYEGPQTGYTGNKKTLPADGELTLVITRNPKRPPTTAFDPSMDPMSGALPMPMPPKP